MANWKKYMLLVLGLAIGIYVLFCAAVYFFPQYFFYNPDMSRANLKTAEANGFPAEVVHYKSADGTALYAWFSKPESKGKIIVFLHGNSYNIEKFYYKMAPLVEAGYGMMMPEYRGFGGIKGQIRQKNLSEDTLAAIKYLNKIGYKNSDIILYGMSLGSYTAINAAFQMQNNGAFDAVILEVPFDSLLNAVKAIVPFPLPFDYIVRDKYDNMEMIKEIHSPVLIMGGRKDKTVPVFLAERLYENAAQPKKIIIYPSGGHTDLFNYRNYRDILNWLGEEK